jgi:hypothetical protein
MGEDGDAAPLGGVWFCASAIPAVPTSSPAPSKTVESFMNRSSAVDVPANRRMSVKVPPAIFR